MEDQINLHDLENMDSYALAEEYNKTYEKFKTVEKNLGVLQARADQLS